MQTNNPVRIRFLTILLGLGQLYAWATTYYLPAALTLPVANELHLSTLAIVGGFSWALLLGGVCAPKIGAWIEHEGGRRPLAVGSFCMGLGLMLLSQCHELILWYLAWSFLGVGMTLGLFNAVFASMGRLLGQGAKTVIINITLISGFATILWPLTTYLIAAVGWRTMVVLYAIPHLMIWCPLFFVSIPKQVLTYDATVSAEEPRVATVNIKRAFYLFAAFAVLRAIVGTTISVDILTMLMGLGFTLTAAAMVASLIGPAQIIGRIIELKVGRQFDPLNSSMFWTAVLPVSIVVLVLWGAPAGWFFAIAYGMSNGVLAITMGILPMVIFGPKGYASLLGQLALPVLLAQAATPLLVDPLLERWSAIHIFYLAGLMGLAALICLIKLSSLTQKTT